MTPFYFESLYFKKTTYAYILYHKRLLSKRVCIASNILVHGPTHERSLIDTAWGVKV